MKKIMIRFFVIVLAAAFISSCASIVSETEYSVRINSSPEHSKFVVRNNKGEQIHSGITPSRIFLRSSRGYFVKANYTVTFMKNGYEDKTIEINSTLDGWYFGNILFGGLVGMLIVDPATGAMWALPHTQSASLTKITSTADSDLKQEFNIVSIDDILDADRARLIRIQ